MSELLAKDSAFVWHPFTQHLTHGTPLPIIRAEGSLLYDEKGKAYIDANSSWWVNTHGHAHPHIEKAITEQFKALDHVVFAGVTHPKAVELAERITSILPDNFNKVFFSDNGSTSTEVAIKTVIQYWHNKGENKRKMVALHGAYHGDTFGAMSVGERDLFNKPFEPLFFDVEYLDFPNQENEQDVLKRAKELFESGEIAGVIVEPMVQGASGMRMYSASFLDQLLGLAKQNDVLSIFDEVMTGFGRTGKMFAMDYCQNKPDFICLSKGLTAGVMALGLTVTSNKIFESFLHQEMAKGMLHGHSFTANPLACAVACANLDLFERDETWQSIQNLVVWNESFASELKSNENVADVRQQGTILAFEVVSDGGPTYFSTIRDTAYKFFIEHGVLIRPLGNVIFINPPYCITKQEYDSVIEVIRKFLKA